MVEIETLFDDSGSGGGVRQLSVESTKRLPDLDQPGSDAYAVVDANHRDESLFGLVCDPRMPLRLAGAEAICGHEIANALTLIAVGRAPIGGAEAMRVLMIYRCPVGRRLITGPAALPIQIDSREMLPRIIGPIAEALTHFEALGLCHGAVRPGNIFLPETGQGGAQLGDAMSAPCSRWQAPVFEPLMRARTMPSGRGEIGPGVDIYALAVSAVSLLKGAVPCHELDEATLTGQILSRGATATIADFIDSQSSTGIVLDGMLQATADKRWSATDVTRWINDRVRPVRLGDRQSEPRRGFLFLGTEYKNTRTLAIAFTAAPEKAAAVLTAGEVTDWLRRSLGEKQVANTLEDILSPDHIDYLGRRLETAEMISRAAIVLDPESPICFRETRVMPDGIGAALAEADADADSEDKPTSDTVEDLVNVVKFGIGEFWLDQQNPPAPPDSILSATLKDARLHAQRKAAGFGARRALYDLNPTLSCRSPVVRDRLIFDVEQVLPALQDSVANTPLKGRLIDRHLASFVASKLNLAESRNIAGLAAPNTEPDKIWRSTIWLLGTLHDRTEGQAFKVFAKWLNSRLSPVLDELHNRGARKAVADRLTLIAGQGDLSAMAAALLNQKVWRSDNESFEGARQQMATIREQIQVLTGDTAYRDRSARKLGGQFALAASYALLGFTLIFVAGTILT